ncbi:hypothetical protein F2P47_05095 [Parvibaculum sedimenti]|uniref:DUF2780 domain-containing protein n=3 Tax=Parvibaculum sedimenti TaxID=2608632 RepID=A0A6N6VK15_9HYPH|nr:hypothetical protein [Parvibaculum sedimenti]KAB7741129.1 hypothetical protein F2P47_05095 [Parvibaculum sedimenti]
MKHRWLKAVVLMMSVIGGSQTVMVAAHAAVADDVGQIVAAHAADADGGAALRAAFASLISNAANPATAAAEVIASLGGASPAALAAVAGAIDGMDSITPDALAAAIGKVVADGGKGADAISATVLAVAQYFGEDNRKAAGRGLAIAVASLKDLPGMADVAGKIIAQVDASGLDEVKTAYAEEASEIQTAGLNNQTGDTLLAKTTPLTTQSPN